MSDVEIWKPIKDYEGLYEVSNLGRVRSLDRVVIRKNGIAQKTKGRIIRSAYNSKTRYWHVGLWKNNYRQAITIHRLVAQAFCQNDNPDLYTCVNHIDGDRSNNKVNNLEWCSESQNLKHSYDKLSRPISKRRVWKRRLNLINKHTNEVIYCESIHDAQRKSGISPSQIRRIGGINPSDVCVNVDWDVQFIDTI